MALAIRAAVVGLLVATALVATSVHSVTDVTSGGSDDGDAAAGPAIHTCGTPPCPTPTFTDTPTPTPTASFTPTVEPSPTPIYGSDPLRETLDTWSGPIAAVVVLLGGLLAVKYGR